MSDLRIVCLCRKFDAHLKDFCCNRMCCSKSRQAALETNEAQTLSINCIFLSVKLGFDNWNFLSVYSRAQGLRVIPCWNKFGEKRSFFFLSGQICYQTLLWDGKFSTRATVTTELWVKLCTWLIRSRTACTAIFPVFQVSEIIPRRKHWRNCEGRSAGGLRGNVNDCFYLQCQLWLAPLHPTSPLLFQAFSACSIFPKSVTDQRAVFWPKRTFTSEALPAICFEQHNVIRDDVI